MLVDAEKMRLLERDIRDLEAKNAAMEQTMVAYRQALVRFGHRVKLCDDRITKMEQSA